MSRVTNDIFRRTAICRGAVNKGFVDGLNSAGEDYPKALLMNMPIKVSSTISKASYGVEFMDHFKEGKHLEEDND